MTKCELSKIDIPKQASQIVMLYTSNRTIESIIIPESALNGLMASYKIKALIEHSAAWDEFWRLCQIQILSLTRQDPNLTSREYRSDKQRSFRSFFIVICVRI